MILDIRSVKNLVSSNPLMILFNLACINAITECIKSKLFLVMTRETIKLKLNIDSTELGLKDSFFSVKHFSVSIK